jgi:hypothetical protein
MASSGTALLFTFTVASMKMTVFWDRPDDGRSKFLLNVCRYLPNYTTQYPEDSHLQSLDDLPADFTRTLFPAHHLHFI